MPSTTPAAQVMNNQRERRLLVTRNVMLEINTPAPPATANDIKIMKKPANEETRESNPPAKNERMDVVAKPSR